MAKQYVKIRGVNEHNLKGTSVDIPRNELVVLIGLSGSGKSSLAFDTIYTEGQGCYMEFLSSYARQFLGQMEKPDVESIEELSPAISIDQKSTNRNPRSIVGAVTEIYGYMRLLYARMGIPHCPKRGKEIHKQSTDQIVDHIMAMPERTKIQLLAPVARGRKGERAKVSDQARKNGYMRVRIDGSLYELPEDTKPDKNIKHNTEIVVDRLIVEKRTEKRLADSIETAMAPNGGLMTADVTEGESANFSQSFSYPDCGISINEVEPRSFSFNNPFGACPECFGLGYGMEPGEDLMIPDKSISIDDGAIVALGWQSCTDKGSFTRAILNALAREYKFSLSTPFQNYPKEIQDVILYGTGGKEVKVRYKSQRGEGAYDVAFEGLIEDMNRRYKETFSEASKVEYKSYMWITPCPVRKGQRFKKESLAVTVGDMNIYQATNMSIVEFRDFMDGLKLTSMQQTIGASILEEIGTRICFLIDVGLDYLSLSWATGTLSGGEAQRIRPATQIDSDLVGVAYILDEPSVGPHQRNNDKLLKTLIHLRDLGNSVLVVEHDEDTMLAVDCIVDIGPGAGERDGQVIAVRTAKQIIANKDSITGAYLSGGMAIPVSSECRKPSGWIMVRGVAENNLKNPNVDFPLGAMTCVTGVSGSGKSSSVNEILYKTLAKKLNRVRTIPGKHKGIDGTEQLDKIIAIDQSSIGCIPWSNPVIHTGAFGLIRDLFASTVDTKAKSCTKDRFSFNMKGRRCGSCSGDGIIKIETHFLPDVCTPCEVCGGKRYSHEVLDVKYKGKSIHDVLDMTVEDVLKFFENVPSVTRKIQILYDVGLGYIRLGQPSTELSSGEAQRIKLVTGLPKCGMGKTIYILDEPTTGLHFVDVHKLIDILRRLSDGGDTVVTIEHNLDVIKIAGCTIDIGPEGGDKGGMVIARGTPGEVAENPVSYTGMCIKKHLEAGNKKGIK